MAEALVPSPTQEDQNLPANQEDQDLAEKEEVETSIAEVQKENLPSLPEQETKTPEQELQERINYASQVSKEIRQREEERLEKRYGKGLLGKARKWLNSTNIGRAVKIGGKIVLGSTAALTAGALTGGVGLIAAPAVFALGTKTAIDGGIEGVMHLAKGHNKRLSLEGAKNDLLLQVSNLENLQSRFEAGEISNTEFENQISELVQGIANQEQEVIKQENDNIKWESKQKMIRGIASSVATIGFGVLHGIPSGFQQFKGLGHAIRFGRHGFEFIYQVGKEAMGQTVHHYLGGAVGHALGHAAPSAAYVGLGTAALGLFMKTGEEITQAYSRKDISQPDPKFLELLPEDQNTPEVNESTSSLAKSEVPSSNLPAQEGIEAAPAVETKTYNSLEEIFADQEVDNDKLYRLVSDPNNLKKYLNLPDNFTQNDLRAAYRQAVLQYHPDKNPESSDRCNAMQAAINDGIEKLEPQAVPSPKKEIVKGLEGGEQALFTIREISQEEAEKIFAEAQLSGTEFKGQKLTKETLQEKGFLPKYEIVVDGKKIWSSSKQFKFGHRSAGLAYFGEEDGGISLSPYLSSGSQGTDRFYPGFMVAGEGQGESVAWFSKGRGEESLEMPIALQEALAKIDSEKIELTDEEAEAIIVGCSNKYSNEYEAMVEGGAFSDVNISPNVIEGIRRERFGDLKSNPESIDLAREDDKPDYEHVISTWQKEDPVYGKVIYEVLESKNKKYRFQFCRDERKRAWIGKIEMVKSPINRRGLKQEWVSAGVLTTPAFEYADQLIDGNGKNYGDPFLRSNNGNYVDSFNQFLSKIPIIKEYLASLQARGG